MPSLPWFPFYYKDFMLSKKVVKMSHSQKGAYVDLLCHEWDSPACNLPLSTIELKKLIQWKGSQKEFILVRSCFTAHPDNPKWLHNARLYQEWMKAHKKQEAAKASAITRWQKPLNGPTHPTTPTPKPTDRTTKGFQPISDEVRTVADKWLPPQ